MSNVDRDVSFSVVYRKLASDDVEGCREMALPVAQAPEIPKPTPMETLAGDLLRLLDEEQNADIEFVIVDPAEPEDEEEEEGKEEIRVEERQWNTEYHPAEYRQISSAQQLSATSSHQQFQLMSQGNNVVGQVPMSGNIPANITDGVSFNHNNGRSSSNDRRPNGVIIRAHKAILTARVPYFERLFGSGMRESETNRVIVRDVAEDDFRQLLLFIYAGRIPEKVGERAKEFLAIGEKYDLAFIKNIAERNLMKVSRILLLTGSSWMDGR